MAKNRGYISKPLPFVRQMVVASVNAHKRNAIHSLSQINVTLPRKRIQELKVEKGVKISFTGYIVKCFAETLTEFPEFNSFIKRRKIIVLEDITVSVLLERNIDGQSVPEPLAIHKADSKTVVEITDEIRAAQSHSGSRMGDLNNATWIKFIPPFLLKAFIRIADKNIFMAKKYGKVAVTAVGMFSESAAWFIPHGTATALLTIGSIERKNEEEWLCITFSFDHELVDGAPAARFISKFSAILGSAENLPG